MQCEGYSDAYDLQETNKAVCLNVGSRGDITSFRQFDIDFESGCFTITVFTRSGVNTGYTTSESYSVEDNCDTFLRCQFGSNLYSALVIAERFS